MYPIEACLGKPSSFSPDLDLRLLNVDERSIYKLLYSGLGTGLRRMLADMLADNR
jgi:hypothetical protein